MDVEDDSHAEAADSRRGWTQGEDDAIISLVDTHGTKRWSVIAEALAALNIGVKRTGKQCRERCASQGRR